MNVYYTKLGRFEALHYSFVFGELHRVDGPAFEDSSGTKKWIQNGNYHRIDGPAIEWYYGDKEWFQNGKLHRIDGPAIERYTCLCIQYWLEGKQYSKEDYEEIVKFYQEGLDILL